jgi:hypothetical protein
MFKCADCGIADVKVEYEYCDMCVEETLRYLEEEDERYHERMKQKFLLQYAQMKYEEMSYSLAGL